MIRKIYISLLITISISINAEEKSPFPEIKDWTRSKEIKQYDQETLWEIINGAADYYLGYNFQSLDVVEYAQSEDLYIKAEIYAHSDKLNAFGIYSYERSGDGDFRKIGTEGYLVHSALNFYTDKYYVKIHSHNSSEETIAAIMQIAELIAKNLNGDNTVPVELENLPTVNQVPNSIKYISSNYMGYGFFRSVLTAKYIDSDISYDLFSISHKTENAAIENLKQYFKFNKIDETPITNKVYIIEDFFNDKVLIGINKQKIIGIWNASGYDEPLKALEKIINEK